MCCHIQGHVEYDFVFVTVMCVSTGCVERMCECGSVRTTLVRMDVFLVKKACIYLDEVEKFHRVLLLPSTQALINSTKVLMLPPSLLPMHICMGIVNVEED